MDKVSCSNADSEGRNMMHGQKVQVKQVLFERGHEMDGVDIEDGNGWKALQHNLHSRASDAETDDSDEDKESSFWPIDQQGRQKGCQHAQLRVQ